MRPPRRLTAAVLALAAAAVAVAAELEVAIVRPAAGEHVLGEIEVVAEVRPPGAAARVEFFLDGVKLGEAKAPPYRLRVELEPEPRDRWLRVRAHGAAGATAEAERLVPALRVDEAIDAELRQLYVTVQSGGRRVLDLERDDFTVFDEGKPQPLITFGRGDLPLAAAILVDASVSMRGERLRSALAGAAAFARATIAADRVSLLLFADRLRHATPFAAEPASILAGLDRVAAGGGTALNDHLYLALKRVEAEQGRRVVVLLSDGVDSHSALRMAETSWLARRSQAILYWIRADPAGGEGSRSSAWKDPAAYRAEYALLGRTVEASGGRILTLERVEDAPAAFAELLRELREQYVLGYYPGEVRRDGSWHEVRVRVARPGVQVRTRDGYVDAGSG